jgi:hypothetical protein
VTESYGEGEVMIMGAKSLFCAALLFVAACGGTGRPGGARSSQEDTTRNNRGETQHQGEGTTHESDMGGKGRGGEHHPAKH